MMPLMQTGAVAPDISRLLPPDVRLEQSILRALAYADVFDYPLTLREIHRYLPGCPTGLEAVRVALTQALAVDGRIERRGPYYMLRGRGILARVRRERARQAEALWPRAHRYAAWLAALPFVRMVALTGALAMENEPGADIDFLVVTEAGRLWLCRGLAMLLVRLARRAGDELCPNYFISTNALIFPAQDLYTAHELAHMIPFFGWETYRRIRERNSWLGEYLPNAHGAPGLSAQDRERPYAPRWLEAALRTPAGERLEQWEMQRKVRKLSAQLGPQAEADFSPDWCKGHFGGYGRRSLAAYQQRLERLGL